MQLVAYGAQDIYLTGNPQITFWKVVYRRHTNFARESIEQTISGTSTAGASTTRGTVVVARNGDLLDGVWVTSETAAIENGDEMVNTVEIQIGGQKIDKHTVGFLQVWNELTTDDSKAAGFKAMTGCVGSSGSANNGSTLVQVPLRFWFCNNPGLALPLIALQYHEVKFIFEWGTLTNIGAAAAMKVWCDYVYLDTDERRRFAQVSHEYLIDQLQYQTEGTEKQSVKLTLNHPVKELIWTNAAANVTTQSAKLKLNGHDRFAYQKKEYFQLRQPYMHHTAVPRQNVPQVTTPELLGSPENILGNVVPTGSCEGHGAATADGKFTITATGSVLRFKSAADPGLKVGDILTISYEITTDSSSNTVIAEITAVTTAWTASGAEAIFVLGAGATELENSVAGDGSVYRIASTQNALARTSNMTDNVNCYSFALEPEEHQPSGTCNFSRIDTATLEFSSAVTLAAVYAVNYNVLRIMSGMGGLAYSN